MALRRRAGVRARGGRGGREPGGDRGGARGTRAAARARGGGWLLGPGGDLAPPDRSERHRRPPPARPRAYPLPDQLLLHAALRLAPARALTRRRRAAAQLLEDPLPVDPAARGAVVVMAAPPAGVPLALVALGLAPDGRPAPGAAAETAV